MKEQEKRDSVFDVLNAINVNGHTEKKKTGSTELTYLSWAWAWAEVKKKFPDAEYTIYRDEQNRPYVEDPDFGLMCYTSVTIQGQTYEMWLPVMNGANKAMRRTPYKYQVWSYAQKKFEDKVVEAATMFDINKTIMRCLVKNLAMFGLGLYIYAGEDLPDTEMAKDEKIDDTEMAKDEKIDDTEMAKDEKIDDTEMAKDEKIDEADLQEAYEVIADNIRYAKSRNGLNEIINDNKALHKYKPFMDAINQRWREVR